MGTKRAKNVLTCCMEKAQKMQETEIRAQQWQKAPTTPFYKLRRLRKNRAFHDRTSYFDHLNLFWETIKQILQGQSGYAKQSCCFIFFFGLDISFLKHWQNIQPLLSNFSYSINFIHFVLLPPILFFFSSILVSIELLNWYLCQLFISFCCLNLVFFHPLCHTKKHDHIR